MDKPHRIAALREQVMELESELTATLKALPEDPSSRREEVARYREMETRYLELRRELDRLESSD